MLERLPLNGRRYENMAIDQASLFIATGICCAALGLTMLSAWVHNRADDFLAGWTLGMLLLGAGVLLNYSYPADRLAIVAMAFTLETIGFVVVYLAARQFTGRAASRRTALALLVAVPPVTVPIVFGFDGIGIAVYNLVAGAFLAATGLQYWSVRAEARSSITALTALYVLTALSFFACGTIMLHEGSWVLLRHPDNWAEKFNAIMCIIGITGIGALSLGLNNARAARRHRDEARTDALTGLLNRRALFDGFSRARLDPGHAVIAFDLDHFKAINDRHGHAAGDEVLRRFAMALSQNLRDGDMAARTGGEEFVLVLHHASHQVATSTAERIRAIFADDKVTTAGHTIIATASAGVAFVSGQSESFEAVLHRADKSLYRAKDGGRNRVVTQLQAVA
ncbi:diguanylate cyclase [Mesorhizobium sp. CAU 1741]|uniref:GGDEF domain-containing protein n=1 Tax=Mesorhizobium sp. CAU 1741 TaxID=3140366 RepID=UPI00325B24AC